MMFGECNKTSGVYLYIPRHESFPGCPPAQSCFCVKTTFCERYTLLHWLSGTPFNSTFNLILLDEAGNKTEIQTNRRSTI